MTPRRPNWRLPGWRPSNGGGASDDRRLFSERGSGGRANWFTRLLRGRAEASAAPDDGFSAVLDSVLKLPAKSAAGDPATFDGRVNHRPASSADPEQVDAVMRRLGFLRDRGGARRHRHWRMFRRGGMLGLLLAMAGLGIVLHNAQPGSIRPASVTVPSAVEAGVGRGADRLGDVIRTLHRLQPQAPSRAPESPTPAPPSSPPARAAAPFRWV